MLIPHGSPVRTVLAVVALGRPERLETCLAALGEHHSREDFSVVVVSNEDDRDRSTDRVLPDGMLAIDLPVNLGWAGGLHRVRAVIAADYLVWVQDDMVPQEGWLDALIEVADAHPDAGAVGSVAVDDEGVPAHKNAGWARPADHVERWVDTDITSALPDSAAEFDWVTSRGLLTRTAAWDEVSGPDPTWFPLNYVDLDYSTHLRAHGWRIYLAPAARLKHAWKQSAPPILRQFLGLRQRIRFNQRWGAVAAELARTGGKAAHSCAEWRELESDPVVAAAGQEATRLVVPFSRHVAQAMGDLTERLGRAERYARESRRAYELEREAHAALRARFDQVERYARESRIAYELARDAVTRLRSGNQESGRSAGLESGSD